jgi:hypothetical protein
VMRSILRLYRTAIAKPVLSTTDRFLSRRFTANLAGDNVRLPGLGD